MLGHTGNLLATIKSIETIDSCLKKILTNLNHNKTTLLITADHGNADIMFDKNNEPCKSHTKNLVPFILINTSKEKNDYSLKPTGSLVDIAPTVLDLLEIKRPHEMDGQSLIINKTEQNSLSFIKQSTFSI